MLSKYKKINKQYFFFEKIFIFVNTIKDNDNKKQT